MLEFDELPPAVLASTKSTSPEYIANLAPENALQSEEAGRIFAMLRLCIALQDTCVVRGADCTRIVMNTADRDILHFLYGGITPGFVESSPSYQRLRILVTAAHMFLYYFVREIPDTSPLAKLLLRRLLGALTSQGPVARLWAGHEPVLAWILFVGFMGSATLDGEREWYATQLRATAPVVLTDSSPESASSGRMQFEKVIASFAWRDKSCRPALDDVWSGFEHMPAGEMPITLSTD